MGCKKGPIQLENDKSFWGLYEKGETIGRGHFAKVKLVRERESGEFFAAKILDKSLEEHQEDYESMMREFDVLRSLHHKNIVNLHQAYESQSSLILVCQLATGGELMHRIAEDNEVYTESEARYHLRTITEAIGFMHTDGVVHRDLKPENILLSDKTSEAHILVADFGLGRFVESQQTKMDTVCGTHHYLAPELVKCDRGELETYDKSVDVWGIGLIAFIMLFGYNPFLRDSNMATHEAIVTCKYAFPKDDNISKCAKDLIKRMLCLDAKKRITVEQALAHPFFAEPGPGDGSDALSVNQNGVRSVMKEFNARRAVMKLTGMRGKNRRASEEMAPDAPTLAAAGAKDDKKSSPAKGRSVMTRRGKSNSEEVQNIAAKASK